MRPPLIDETAAGCCTLWAVISSHWLHTLRVTMYGHTNRLTVSLYVLCAVLQKELTRAHHSQRGTALSSAPLSLSAISGSQQLDPI